MLCGGDVNRCSLYRKKRLLREHRRQNPTNEASHASCRGCKGGLEDNSSVIGGILLGAISTNWASPCVSASAVKVLVDVCEFKGTQQ